MRGVLEPEMHGMGPVLGTLTSLLWTVFVGAAAGFVGALVLGFPLRRHWIPDDLQSPVTLGLVLGVFTGADRLAHESGLLAVTLMGALLVNQRRTPIRHIIEFKENLRVLLISSLFVVLAARVEFAQLFPVDLGAVAFVAFLIVLVRPISVWLASLGSGLARREVAFIAWMAPRGVVAAAVSALFAAQLEQRFPNDASRLASLAILVIIGTVLVYGLTAGPLAQRLGLSDPDPQGCLLAGGGAFALTLARAIQAAGLPVVLMDTNRAHVAQARLDGLTAVWGSVLAEDAAEEVPLGARRAWQVRDLRRAARPQPLRRGRALRGARGARPGRRDDQDHDADERVRLHGVPRPARRAQPAAPADHEGRQTRGLHERRGARGRARLHARLPARPTARGRRGRLRKTRLARRARRAFEILARQQSGTRAEPRHAETHLLLGNLYQQLGQADKALAAWQLGASLFPSHEGLHKQLQLAQGDE
jgi:hypothetical protein